MALNYGHDAGDAQRSYDIGFAWSGAPPQPHSQPYDGPRHAAWLAETTPLVSQPLQTRHGRHMWPLLANDLFLVAHDDYGKQRLHRSVAKKGLAAALIGELIIAGYTTIRDGHLHYTSTLLPIDPLAGSAILQVRAERRLPVGDWLTFFATTDLGGVDLYDQVGRRLARAGNVHAHRRRFRQVRYVPVNGNVAARAWASISGALNRGLPMNESETTVAGLIVALDLHREVLTGDRAVVEQQLRDRIAGQPEAIRELICVAEKAVGAAVMTGP
jgi:hypothetical protein